MDSVHNCFKKTSMIMTILFTDGLVSTYDKTFNQLKDRKTSLVCLTHKKYSLSFRGLN